MSDSYPTELQELLDQARECSHDVQTSREVLAHQAERATQARMRFLEAKAARFGFLPNAVFKTMEYQYRWVHRPNKEPEWIKDASIEVLSMIRGVSDAGDHLNVVDTYLDPNCMPTILYSRRLKSGRWSTRTSYLWSQDINELMKEVELV